jgi:hypothetical protein
MAPRSHAPSGICPTRGQRRLPERPGRFDVQVDQRKMMERDRPPPANETVVAGGVRTEAVGQIAPWCSGPQDPEDAIEERRSLTRGTPRGLFGSIGLMAAHS